MVDYNRVAGKFYEKNGFTIINSKKNYYTIEEKKYNAVVYIWYKDKKRAKSTSEDIFALRFLKIPSNLISFIVKKNSSDKK